MKLFVGISGASGVIYAGRLLKALAAAGSVVTVCISDGALEVIRLEERLDIEPGARPSREVLSEAFFHRYGLAGAGQPEVALPGNLGHAFASGSHPADAAIVCPCSMSTVASMATGVTRNLIHRVADVALKESRPLIVVPRETPLSEIHLRNLLALKRAGAVVLPAAPAFYHQPRTVEDLADFIAGKVLDQLGIGHELYARWGER